MHEIKSQVNDISNIEGKPNRIWTAIILGILAAIGPLCIDLYLPLLPQIGTQLQSTPSLVQLSLTACLLGLALGQIVIGPNSDVFGRVIVPINLRNVDMNTNSNSD